MTNTWQVLGLDPAHPKFPKRWHEALNHLRETPADLDDVRRFTAFAAANAHRSKAQLFQDLWALWVSGGKRGGYFVEVGAADGVNLSNSWLLEQEMSWRGLLAEPNPRFLDQLGAARSSPVCAKAVHSQSGRSVEFITAKRGEFSRVAEITPDDGQDEARLRGAGRATVETITLNDMLAEHGAPELIDYLSIDTEGAELEILRAFDFGRWDVRAITVEHNWSPAREPLYELLTAQGYRRLWPDLSRFDDWYVKA
jgi:FkbM family methyltransferase